MEKKFRKRRSVHKFSQNSGTNALRKRNCHFKKMFLRRLKPVVVREIGSLRFSSFYISQILDIPTMIEVMSSGLKI